ncbi:hypothetical protein CRUP_033120 [Coryphaenoides rupestris]|nr:hypothetical protein CRUP_033120 [Coryphaenoides rupestris]
MARWGEGDPRWIVEERSDATNVNNWHWELLLGCRVEEGGASCQLTDVTKLEGEASINNRKGKLIYFYEWVIKASWLASHGMILPTAGGPSQPPPQPPPAPVPKKVTTSRTQISTGVPATAAPKRPQQASAGTTGVRISTTSFSLKETFLTSPDELYRTFINQEFVQVFTHSDAQVDGCRGGKFQLLDGNVNGEFAELIPDEKIVMRWRFKTWPCEHYATISLRLKGLGDETELSLDCKGVPSGEEERTKEGWKRYYFAAIKQTFGYGASLY